MTGSMGRRRQTDHDLPPRLRRKGRAYYFVTSSAPRKWIPLGCDLQNALRQWADIAGSQAAGVTFAEVAKAYRKLVYPEKAPRTRKDNDGEFKMLEAVFGKSPFDSITHKDVAKYHAVRGAAARTRANREIALLSHVWNFARSAKSGYLTEKPNPCAGVERFKEHGREVYVSDEILLAIVDKADQALKDAIWLALLTGQRPTDVLGMRRERIRDGALELRQGKTGKALRLRLQGTELGILVQELTTRERKVSGPWLVQKEDGQRLTYWALAKSFQRARIAAAEANPKLAEDIGKVQFRDLRAKSGTEMADEHGILAARRLLGHASVTMTEAYVRLGEKVAPLK